MTMSVLNYRDVRDTIQTGDVLVWKKDRLSFLSNLFLKLIRFFTLSEFAHTAVAWRVGDRLFAIEATQPFVRIIPISAYDEFYHIPLKLTDVKESSINFLLEQVGRLYSLKGALRAYLDLPLDYADNAWQCAELTGEFLKKEGIEVEGTTPSDLVEDLLLAGYSIELIKSRNI